MCGESVCEESVCGESLCAESVCEASVCGESSWGHFGGPTPPPIRGVEIPCTPRNKAHFFDSCFICWGSGHFSNRHFWGFFVPWK